MRSVLVRLLSLLYACSLAWPCLAEGTVRVAFGESLEPYVMADHNSGIEVEIIRAAFAARGLSMSTQSLSQPRLPAALERPEIDAVATLGRQSGIKAYFSNTYVVYEDVAIALKSRHLKLNQVADLARFNVLAFSRATYYLGTEFRAMAALNSHYAETADQLNQNRLLYRGGIDIAVADRRIFLWMDRKQALQFHEKPQPVDWFHLFPPTSYQLACRSLALCETFNQGLKIIQNNGEYEKILASYR